MAQQIEVLKMLDRLKNWLKNRFSTANPSSLKNLRDTGAYAISQVNKPTAADSGNAQAPGDAVIEEPKSGEKALIRNKYVREDTGTHETLKILDDSIVDSGEETGLDPYNTGGFDRSKNWQNRFRK